MWKNLFKTYFFCLSFTFYGLAQAQEPQEKLEVPRFLGIHENIHDVHFSKALAKEVCEVLRDPKSFFNVTQEGKFERDVVHAFLRELESKFPKKYQEFSRTYYCGAVADEREEVEVSIQKGELENYMAPAFWKEKTVTQLNSDIEVKVEAALKLEKYVYDKQGASFLDWLAFRCLDHGLLYEAAVLFELLDETVSNENERFHHRFPLVFIYSSTHHEKEVDLLLKHLPDAFRSRIAVGEHDFTLEEYAAYLKSLKKTETLLSSPEDLSDWAMALGYTQSTSHRVRGGLTRYFASRSSFPLGPIIGSIPTSHLSEARDSMVAALRLLGRLPNISPEILSFLIHYIMKLEEQHDVTILFEIGKSLGPKDSLLHFLLLEGIPSEQAQKWTTVQPAAVSALIKLSRDNRIEIRFEVVNILKRIGRWDPQLVIQTLVETLNDAKGGVQHQTISAFREISIQGIEETIRTSVIPALLGFLKEDKNSMIRENAVKTLEKLWGVSFHPALIQDAFAEVLLRDVDDGVRSAAASALGSQLEVARSAIPTLLRILKNDRNGELRERAVQALSHIGKADPSSVIPVLIDTLKNDKWARVRSISAGVLKDLWKIASASESLLIQNAFAEVLLRDADDGVRFAATSALGSQLEVARSAIPTLLHILKNDRNAELRERAAYALAHIGKADPSSVVPVLIETLKHDKHKGARLGAITALREICRAAKVICPLIASALVEALKDKEIQEEVVSSLWMLTSQFTIIPKTLIVEALKHQDVQVRVGVIKLLGQMEDDEGRSAIPHLIKALRDVSEEVRFEAAGSINKIGERWVNQSDILALIELLNDEDKNIRYLVKYILSKIGHVGIIPALAEALKDKRERIRAGATTILVNIQKEQAAPLVIELLRNDKDVTVRIAAAEALTLINGEVTYPSIISGLIEALKKDGSEEVRAIVVSSLSHVSLSYEVSRKQIISVLIEALKKDASEKVRVQAAFMLPFANGITALTEKGKRIADPSIISALIEVLREDGKILYTAAISLGNIAKVDQSAIPTLKEAMNDENGWVRIGIGFALVNAGSADQLVVPSLVELLKQKNALTAQKKAVINLLQYAGTQKGGSENIIQALEKILEQEREPEIFSTIRKILEEIKESK